ncbi:hypothetical protein DITRI_Ditri04bG0066000 [Diplodiscus trichospermus]
MANPSHYKGSFAEAGNGDTQEPALDNSNKNILGNKGRRPNVQISEKEVMSNGLVSYVPKMVNMVRQIEGPKKSAMVGVKSRQTASETEHTVVKGSEGGKNIVRTVINTGKEDRTIFNPLFLRDGSSSEHHNDPLGTLDLKVHGVNHMEVERGVE